MNERSAQNQSPKSAYNITQQPTENKGLSKSTVFLLLILSALLFSGLGAGGYWFFTKDKEEAKPRPQGQSCSYNDQTYNDGDNFDSTDGCNTCICSDGEVACTLRACDQESENEPENGINDTEDNHLKEITFRGFKFQYPEDWLTKITDKTEEGSKLENTYLFMDRESIQLYPMLYAETHIRVLEGDRRDFVIPDEESICQWLGNDFVGNNFTFKVFYSTCDGDFINMTYHTYVRYDAMTNSTLLLEFRAQSKPEDIEGAKEFIEEFKKIVSTVSYAE